MKMMKRFCKQSVALQEGNNRYTFSHISATTGLIKYEALVQTANDAFLENNKLTSVTTVQASPRLLIVKDDKEADSNSTTNWHEYD